MYTVYLGLGSNIGDRIYHLDRAALMVNNLEQVKVTKLSSVYETDPVGGPPQGRYYNAVIEVETGLRPIKLLQFSKEIEQIMGRETKGRWESRCIDIDLLAYPSIIMKTPLLTLPHVLLARRWFVLVPLVEIAPDLVPPGYSRPVSALLEKLGKPEGVDRLELHKPWTLSL